MKPGQFYHIFNRANDPNRLFRNADNYLFFLARYSRYIEPVAETYAYCLLPNHFHFLVRIREKDEILLMTKKNHRLNPRYYENIEEFISRQFSNLFNSYAKAYNKMFMRRGALFMHNFKYKSVDTTAYLRNAIVYIHRNPEKHGLVRSVDEWEWSSLNAIRLGDSSVFSTGKLMTFFDSNEQFLFLHEVVTDIDWSIPG
jgi:putative transposase